MKRIVLVVAFFIAGCFAGLADAATQDDCACIKDERADWRAMSQPQRDIAFYHGIGEILFGGGMQGDMKSIKHIEGLAAAGKTKEIDKLVRLFLADRVLSFCNPESRVKISLQ